MRISTSVIIATSSVYWTIEAAATPPVDRVLIIERVVPMQVGWREYDSPM
jgi:hypothetical protein